MYHPEALALQLSHPVWLRPGSKSQAPDGDDENPPGPDSLEWVDGSMAAGNTMKHHETPHTTSINIHNIIDMIEPSWMIMDDQDLSGLVTES